MNLKFICIFWEGHKILRNLRLTFDCVLCTVVKSKENISKNFVAFSEYMNFNKIKLQLFIAFDSIMPFLWFPTSATCMTKRHWDFSSFFKWFLKDVSVCRKYECSSEPREMVEMPKTTRGFGRNCLACKWTLWKIKSLEILQPERYNKVLEAK